jgi:serine/threonine-protein phosphatase 2A regulatory subunit A
LLVRKRNELYSLFCIVVHLILACHFLPTITNHAMCVKELLPFVTDGTDDEDEVLLALANSLGKLIPLVGGGSHAQSLLPPLEMLLTVEENSVRDAATESTLLVAAALPEETFHDKYAPMLTRLARKEWFTARISSAGLIANAYPRLTPIQQKEHLALFAELCQDDTPMVRRVAAQSLGKMVGNVVGAAGRASLEKGGVVTTILIPLYETLSSNEQPVSVILVFRYGASRTICVTTVAASL